MRSFFSFLTALILLAAFELPAQIKNSAPVKKIAILPTITNINKAVLRTNIDSASRAQIQEREAFSEQSKNYYFIAQKNPNYNVVFQPFNQTNSILQEAGITYAMLPEINHKELAALLEVDMIFYGINYRVPDPNTPEGRLAINAGLSLLLPPFIAATAKATDKPITTIHYLLYDSTTDKAIWHYKNETTKPGNYQLDNFRRFLVSAFPVRR